jgi:hypothetical protein
MVEHHESIDTECEFGVSLALVIAELHLEHGSVETLYDSAHLATNESMFGHVHEQSDHVESVDGRNHRAPRAFQYSGRRRP